MARSARYLDRAPMGWARSNQRASGRWFRRSPDAERAHHVTNAGAAYALMALRACGVEEK